jgi:hypothetical protein
MTIATRRFLLCGSIGMLALAGCAADQPQPPAAAVPPPPPPSGAFEVGVVEAVATVESVDRTAREVLLRGPQGGLLTVRAGRQVRNFDRIRAGDRLLIRYERAVAAYIAPVGQGGSNVEGATVALRSARGQRPAGAVGDVVRVRVGIEAVDQANNTVTFVGPRGRVRTVTVKDPRMQEVLRGLKGGDQVDIVYEEALAVSMVPAPRQ